MKFHYLITFRNARGYPLKYDYAISVEFLNSKAIAEDNLFLNTPTFTITST